MPKLSALVAILACLVSARGSGQGCPELEGRWPVGQQANAVAVTGRHAYLATDGGLTVLDVTERSAPRVLGVVRLPGPATAVALADGLAYLTTADSRLRVVDVSNPAVPVEVGACQTSGAGSDVAVAGGYAFVAAGGLEVVDVSDRMAPVEVGSWNSTLGVVGRVAVSGTTAYVTYNVSHGGGMAVLDVSTPANPVELGSTLTPFDTCTAVAVSDQYAYVGFWTISAGFTSGLQVVDVSQPAAPAVVGRFELYPGYVRGVAVAGTAAFLAHSELGLVVLDVSAPSAPALLGLVDPPAPARALAVSSDLALVAADWPGLRVVDVSDLSAPVEVGAYAPPDAGALLAASGDYAYLAGWPGLVVVDVARPAAPFEVGQCETSGNPVGIAVGGTRVLLANGDTGLGVVDVSNPSSPFEVGVLDTVGYAYAVAAAGDHAYLAVGESGLRVVDITDPSAPREVAAVDTHGPAQGVAVAAGHAFVAAGAAGLRVVDVSDPENPYEVGAWDPPPPPPVSFVTRQVEVKPGIAYVVATEWNGWFFSNAVMLVDVSDPTAPFLAGSYPGAQIGPYTGHEANIAVEGDYLYLLQGFGLEVVDVSSPAAPVRVGLYDYEEYFGYVEACDGRVLVSGGEPCSLCLFAPCGSYAAWVELAVHGPGLEGSGWRSDVAARNPGSTETAATFVLHTASGEYEHSVTVPGQGQLVLLDVVGLLGLEDKGALEVRSDQPLQVSSRIYDEAADGTYGQGMDGRAASEGLDRAEYGWLLGLRQHTGDYRTNLSVTNTGTQPAQAAITLYATDGTELATYVLAVGAGMTVQDLGPFAYRAGRPDLGWGFARVESRGVDLLASASVVDSRTNDATTVVMQPDPPAGGAGDSLWVELAVHLPGLGGSEWRSDVVVRNPGGADVPLTFVLHTASGNHEHDAVVGARAQGVFLDLVGSMGLADKGALEVRCQSPLQVSSRIYTDGQGGTYGQSMDGRTGASGLGGQSGWLLGLRQEEGRFRTNLSVTNTGFWPARAVVTLLDTDGQQLGGRYLLEVGPGLTVQDLEPFARRVGRPDLGWGFARVEVTQGSGVLTSASVVDTGTNDPTTVTMRR